jgi:hypothetical protein
MLFSFMDKISGSLWFVEGPPELIRKQRSPPGPTAHPAVQEAWPVRLAIAPDNSRDFRDSAWPQEAKPERRPHPRVLGDGAMEAALVNVPRPATRAGARGRRHTSAGGHRARTAWTSARSERRGEAVPPARVAEA